ncbi:hypothetical protein H2201_008791 [Coniosporium apollinis]|uniref:Cellulose-binding Sde182 nucleoside hydrolase-like domain-containing protein n=2 Tax=Coniosporium TaxID=2810619 RepID=A0ABQ9NFC6_9PEZI|nr:hypothetical protein H2199_002698 [Cladosporium sp. JES 115]KAJ9655506.1 hypothetical protein H2201_008791 [Coniosporium apollinis]
MHKIIDAYANMTDDLNAHVHPDFPYPSAEYFRSIVRSGPKCYGMEAVKADVPLSDGALLLQKLESSQEPLWVLCWGGTNVLAQVLSHIQTLPAAADARLRAKLRVYAISDQDDTGAWLRARFPDLFYICSVHGWNQYGRATWAGIAGDRYYRFDQGGPDFTTVSREWLRQNVQVGPLGAAYPDYMFIPEGDSPTFLYLIQNGLGVRERPEYGS